MEKNFLRKVEEERAFWLCIDHFKTIAKVLSLEELLTALKKAPFQVFLHHLRRGNNDFADWVEDVVGDSLLAKRLKRIKESEPKKLAEKIIETFDERIKELKEQKIAKKRIFEYKETTRTKIVKRRKKI